MAEFEKAQNIVGILEGGYQNNPRDNGNYYNGQLIGTNWGISAPTLAEYLKRSPSVSDMKNLTKATAIQILQNRYWTKNNLGLLKNQSVANLIYDGTVNHGNNGMRYIMQQAVLLVGKTIEYKDFFSRKAIDLLNKLDSQKLFYAIKQVRTQKYKASSKKYFIKGWLNRLNKIKYNSDNSFSTIMNVSLLAILGIVLITYGSFPIA